jgi:DHA3 family macrolide efflux protein-like MFS transporter
MSADWKKKFIIIWSGQFFSLLSSALVNFAIIIWLSIETGSAQVLAFASIAALMPQAIIGPFTGVFIDRWNRKRTMIAADSFIALCTLVISLLFYFDIRSIGLIYFLLVLRSVGSAFHMPAMQASIPLLAPESQLTRIAGINGMLFSISNIAGPALAAVFISFMDIGQVMLIDVAGAFIAVISLLFVVIPDPERHTEEKLNIFGEMKDAYYAVHKVKGMITLFLFFVVVIFFLMPVSILFPLMTLQHFAGTTYQMSLIEVVWGVGMLIGGGLLSIKKHSLNEVVVLNFTYIIIGLSFTLSGLLPASGYILFVIFTTAGGMAGAVNHATFTAIIQKNIDPVYLGRVFSLNFSATFIPSIIGMLSTGFIADYIGLTFAFVISGAVIILAGIISFFIPALLRLGEQKDTNTQYAVGSMQENAEAE